LEFEDPMPQKRDPFDFAQGRLRGTRQIEGGIAIDLPQSIPGLDPGDEYAIGFEPNGIWIVSLPSA
jgi:hypothetical protein